MNKKELMKKAHKMTKEIKAENPTIDYKFQRGLCLTYLQKNYLMYLTYIIIVRLNGLVNTFLKNLIELLYKKNIF